MQVVGSTGSMVQGASKGTNACLIALPTRLVTIRRDVTREAPFDDSCCVRTGGAGGGYEAWERVHVTWLLCA